MAMVLEEVLRRGGALRLARLEYLGAEPVLEPSEVDATSGAGIRRHRFEIELRGSYLPTLTYVRALEGLPWAFFENLSVPRRRASLGLRCPCLHPRSRGMGWCLAA
jgi:hypothetical protein